MNEDKKEKVATIDKSNTSHDIISSDDNNLSTFPDVSNSKTEEQKEKVNTEDNLEIRKMKFKDRLKAKKARLLENMEGMTKKEKLKHLLYYYKWHAFAVVMVLFLLIYVPVSIYQNKRPVALAYAVMNTPNAYNLKTSLIDDYLKYYDLKHGYKVESNTAVVLSLDTYAANYNAENSSYSQFPTFCYQGYYDIIISDYDGAEFCSATSLTHTLEEALPEEIYNVMMEKYPDLVVELPDYNNKMCPYAFDISDTDFAKNFNLGYHKVYISFIGLNEQNKTNSARFLNYILNLGLEL